MAKLLIPFSLIIIALGGCASTSSRTTASTDKSPKDAKGLLSQMAKELANEASQKKDFDTQGRLRVSVSFESEGRASASFGKYLAQELDEAAKKDFTLLSRNELSKITAEQDLSMSGQISDDSLTSSGNLAGAQALLVGTVAVLADDLMGVNLKLINAETGVIMGLQKADFPCSFFPQKMVDRCSKESRCKTTKDLKALLGDIEAKTFESDKLDLLEESPDMSNEQNSITSADLQRLTRAFQSSRAQMRVVQKLGPGLCSLSTNHAMQILQQMVSPEARITTLQIVLPKLSNPDKRMELLGVFKFPNYRQQAKSILRENY